MTVSEKRIFIKTITVSPVLRSHCREPVLFLAPKGGGMGCVSLSTEKKDYTYFLLLLLALTSVHNYSFQKVTHTRRNMGYKSSHESKLVDIVAQPC